MTPNETRLGGWRTWLQACGFAFCAAATAGCAPDAVTNYKATGFDGYLKTLQSSCQQLVIGAYDIGNGLRHNAIDQNFSWWLDMTSKLYYNRISPDQYRNDVSSFLGDGSSNAAAFNCIFGNLPASRPDRPHPAVN